MAAARARQGALKPRIRSRIVAGTQLLPTVHPQSMWARLVRDELERLTAHCGGEDVISEPRRLAARRIAVLEAELVHVEDRIGKIREAGNEPEPALVEYYGRLADRQRRQGEVIGYERATRDITPTIHQYAAMKAAERAKEEESE